MKVHQLPYFILLLLASCARQTSPTGGPQDTAPPVLLSSIPANNQTLYSDKTITLNFNEFVQLNNPNEQIIITPALVKNFKAVVRKNRVVITIDEDWKPNTTYAINFREAIQDITEKNPAQDLKLAFSTGSYIDSLSIAGTVELVLKNQPMENVTVALTDLTDTFDIFTDKPQWLTRSKADGSFLLENLKPGNYLLYAFDDKNKNLIVDSRNEAHGFLEETIELDSNIVGQKLHLAQVNANAFRILQGSSLRNYVNLRLSSGVRSYKIESPSENIHSTFGEDPTQIRIYLPSPENDSTQIRFYATDSLSRSIDSVFYIRLNPRVSFNETFSISPESVEFLPEKKTITASIRFTKPVTQLNADSILFKVDTLLNIPAQNQSLDSTGMLMSISISLTDSILNLLKIPDESPAKTRYRSITLYLGSSAFISITQDSSRQIIKDALPVTSDQRGLLIVHVNCDQSFKLELLDNNFNVVRSSTNAQTVFDLLPPRPYQLRLLVDTNKNGAWDPPNFVRRTKPEPVLFYKNSKGEKTIPLRANFEVGPLLISCQ